MVHWPLATFNVAAGVGLALGLQALHGGGRSSYWLPPAC